GPQDRFFEPRGARAADRPALAIGGSWMPVADHRRVVDARGPETDDGTLDQGTRRPGRSRRRRLHGLPGRGRRGARQGSADQDALGARILCLEAREASGPQGCSQGNDKTETETETETEEEQRYNPIASTTSFLSSRR